MTPTAAMDLEEPWIVVIMGVLVHTLMALSLVSLISGTLLYDDKY